jgi:hypothetical protein
LTYRHDTQRRINPAKDLLYGRRLNKSTSPSLEQYFIDVDAVEVAGGSLMTTDIVVKQEKLKVEGNTGDPKPAEQDEQTDSIQDTEKDEADQNQDMQMDE